MYPEQFEQVMRELRIIAPAIGRTICVAAAPATKQRGLASEHGAR
jgi:hypothetical protein